MNHPYFPAARRPLRRTSQLLPLEQRFMFDGAVADAAHAAQVHDAAAAAAAVPPAVIVRAAEPAKDEGKKEVVLVDTSLANYKSLEAGVRAGVGIVEFDGNQDGLAQIAKWAATDGGYDAIHILSHGTEGLLILGTTTVSTSSLSSSTVQAELAQLGQALTSNGDLLLYGCDLAAGKGSALLAGLAQATGADVAASTDTTGAARLGGNWTLEAHTGDIDVRALALGQYDATLGVFTVVDADLPNGNFYNTTIYRTFDGHAVGLYGPNLAIDATNLLYAADAGLTGNIDLTINVANGAVFTLNSLQMYMPYQPAHFVVTYYGGATTSFDLAINGNLQTISSFGKSMANLISVHITASDYIGMQDFNINTSLPDTTPPTTTFSNVGLSVDNGASSTDRVTNTASQTVNATLSAVLDAGDKVEASVNGGTSWIDVTSKVSGTALSWNGATLTSGTNNLSFRVTDAAGNVGPITNQSYTLDTVAPTTTIATLKFSSDTGTSNSDFITNDAAQTVSGTLSANLVSGETVYVSLNNGTTWTAASATVGAATWSLGGVTLASSSTLRVKVTDLAGNDATVRTQAYTYDITAPNTTFSGLSFSADTGVAGDFVTKTAAQTIIATLSGSLSAGDILYGSLDGGSSWSDITSKVSGTALSWNGVTLTSSNTLQLKVTDAAGNNSTVRSQAYTLDTTAPATPATPTLDTDTGVSASDHITKDNTPTLSGTAEAGSTVTLYDGATLLGTTVATGGAWSYTTGTMSDASHSYNVTATDLAGNVSAASAGLTVSIDSTAPTVGSVAVPANGTYYTGDPLSFTVNFNETVLVDTSGGTPRLAITIGATTRYATYVSGSGSSALVFSYSVANGDIDANGIALGALSVNGGTLRDTAGNDATLTLNSVGNTANVDVDGTDPSITNISASNLDGAYGAGATITITLDFSTAVTVDTSGGTPTLALDGGGSATYTGGSGTGTLSFSYVVGAGQNSADLDVASTSALSLNGATITDTGGAHRNASVVLATPGTAGSLGANKAIVIDTAAPTVTSASGGLSNDTGTFANDRITSATAQDLQGTLSASLGAGETVQVSLDNGASWHQAAITGGTNWKLAGQTLSVGTGAFLVKVQDAAGNQGTAASYSYTVDQTAPTLTIGSLGLSADTGISHTDFITNSSAQTVTATLSSALGAGDVVYGSLDNGASWSNITSNVSGTALNWNGVTLASSNTLKLKVSDAAGNDGAIQLQAYTLDTTGPVNTVASVVFSNDSGASKTDFITKTATQDISGTLSANLGADETVYVSLDNGASWHAASATVGTSNWTMTNQTLVASDTLQVKVSDAAGNDGSVLSQAYVYATSASVPTVDPLTTPSLTPVLSGHATLAAGETMTVTVGGATYNVVPVAGAWSLDLASAVPVSGALTLALNTQYSVVASVTDLAGNSANDASNGELIVGTLAPPAVPPTTAVTGATLSNDSGASSSDFITNVAQQTISGTLSAPLLSGERVEVSLDGGATWSGASASGSRWLFGATLSGSNAIQVRVSGNGGTGSVYSQSYTLDTTPPASASANAQTASSLTPVLSGAATLADGDQLSVSVGGAQYAVSVSDGHWRLDLGSATPASGNLALVAGNSYSIVTTVTDLAGNRSSGSGQLTIASVPTVTSLALSADSGTSTSDFITNVAAQTLSGSLSTPLTTGQAVEVSVDGGATWQAASASGNSWSASVTLHGSNTLQARVTIAGAGSSTPLRQAYVLDTAAPQAAPVLGAQTANGNLSGSLSAPLAEGETLMASRDGGATWTAVGASGQSWSIDSNGASAVQLMVRDSAGNSGAALVVNTTVQPEQPEQPTAPIPIPPEVSQPVPPVAPVLTSGLTPPAATNAGGQSVPASAGVEPAAPLVLQVTNAGGDLATNWPGQTPPTVLDTLPALVALQPAPDFAPAGLTLASTLPSEDGLSNGFRIITLPELPGRDALVAYTPIPDVSTASGERISVQVGSDAFAHSGDNANVTLTAQSADGAPLPGWLRFDGRTARFEGTPPLAFEGTLSFKVTARDSQGRVAMQVFKIVVSKDGAKTSWHSEPAEPVGRASLNEQLRSARSGGVARLAALSS